MSKAKATHQSGESKEETASAAGTEVRPSAGGELHQIALAGHSRLTTNQGLALSDNQNSLRTDPRGPALLEDFILREKITHFDHERIPERIVHARATGVHGYFELSTSLKQYTKARILTEVREKTPVFTRLSTVAGGAGSVDTPRVVGNHANDVALLFARQFRPVFRTEQPLLFARHVHEDQGSWPGHGSKGTGHCNDRRTTRCIVIRTGSISVGVHYIPGT